MGASCSAGEPGMRVALTNARIMIHQPSGGARAWRRTSRSRPRRSAHPAPDERADGSIYGQPLRRSRGTWSATNSSRDRSKAFAWSTKSFESARRGRRGCEPHAAA
jgi:hypothetical protein